ncbi:MAG: sigma-70 family RNA polymerase sigma factor [Oscillospiraceae bacterium]
MNTAETCAFTAEELIARIRNGETHLRDVLLKSNWGFITAVVTKMTGAKAKNTEAFSVALEAFNEAIDRYDPEKNASFASFSGMVINRRVIDYLRRVKKYAVERSYSSFDTDGAENPVEQISSDSHRFVETLEIQEEIMEFKQALSGYGISFEDLIRLSPKHGDTRLLCAKISGALYADKQFSRLLKTDGRLPVADIAARFRLSRRTVEKHRKYIIALYLVLESNLELIKSYIEALTKGVDGQ